MPLPRGQREGLTRVSSNLVFHLLKDIWVSSVEEMIILSSPSPKRHLSKAYLVLGVVLKGGEFNDGSAQRTPLSWEINETEQLSQNVASAMTEVCPG